MRTAAVIVAAGRGERAGQSTEGPKQYRRIGGQAVLAHTLRTFLACEQISPVVVVIHSDDHDLYHAALQRADIDAARIRLVTGGPTRQESTRLGLLALCDDAPDYVMIHDGVRPFITQDLLKRIMIALHPQTGVLPALAVSDTLKQAGGDALVTKTVPRAGLFAAQTPQSFPFVPILDAHNAAFALGRTDFTDDAAIAEWQSIPVRVVEGSADNTKITWAKDIEMADQRLRQDMVAFPDIRTGNGYDVHSFEAGDHVWLCGVKIPHTHKLNGHSDADVALHALTDALLATRGAGDIGTHFPPSDPQWKGAASRQFVEFAVKTVREAGGRIANADITLIAEEPKIGPHREAMTAELSDMLGVSADRVSVKATTNEKMGFVGRKEGIASIVTVSVIYPGEVPA
ncbi:bifunctional 2-C-methyl-D-erythritol 4-phosphate cytidylyltransferase/2-C-methyl-D-erythritol 2,4-cyclodiphosphate synthase [Pseudochrobactrum saccharolyticum]|uniref:bifunctional 2-C-methyl-D-erythritol 4-phosphate cytidylyltransferase/2-C-methyl-D-erythritol 2,4-cyclodiphosphate synthase n=1 Tax=Pseudochrobactrum saccharolyticum TaxID=354352 RepID=UPI0012461D7B|nr:bifunctional 2-C-methyl-D-erythritol 4-phosphate cytidylyltransferase/2-C-methyl-D-erythritol 2,4-cyclodiphosphate synthase [Pseudochrobactrum saccharolyticum]KAB0539165.1 bifunctional 2-C-methyl-D-erythritol 4-phosphate cytidylyltransferase/2-C-methyl-D-erythritol 2,4-cyclodiphosphate synthase [Pseudochrobactrum saccharolyticum]MDP8249477.1 bifunctional 2-C-methyl-D-erythritol 4-phosphate cytidylyltransferase/2-C-methyl-D-erythritol 2,4-cyclodiphosphate synthase [Pseudochrobactrum saccharolyt